MKTKDLIKILNQYDPIGDKEVLISNNDIDYIIKEPMYNDGKGHVISERQNFKTPKEVTLKSSGEKINLIPLETWDFYRKSIIQDQKFIDIKTENEVFYWETPKLIFNKIISLFYCKEYLKYSDVNLFPYKNTLITKINSEVDKVLKCFYKKYIDYLKKMDCKKNIKNKIFELVERINYENNSIILTIPLVENKYTYFRTVGFKNFSFEIYDSLINFNSIDIYDKDALPIKNTNINSQTFNFKDNISVPWQILFDRTIEKMIYD